MPTLRNTTLVVTPLSQGRKKGEVGLKEIEEQIHLLRGTTFMVDFVTVSKYVGPMTYGESKEANIEGLRYEHCWEFKNPSETVTVYILTSCQNCKARPRVHVTSTHAMPWVYNMLETWVRVAADIIQKRQ